MSMEKNSSWIIQVTSIQDYINPEILRRYDAVDINVYAASLFHTRMMMKEPDLTELSVSRRIFMSFRR